MKRKEAISLAVDEGNDAYKRGVIAGRKEVCDWIKTNRVFFQGDDMADSFEVDSKEWVTKLNKWE